MKSNRDRYHRSVEYWTRDVGLVCTSGEESVLVVFGQQLRVCR